MKKLILFMPVLVLLAGFVFVKPAQATTVCYYFPWLEICNHNEPSPSPSPSVSPSPSPSPSEEPSPSPLPSEVASPSAEPSSTPHDNGFSAPEPKGPPEVCHGREIKHAPTVSPENVKRVDADTIWIKWSPVDDGIDDFIVEYSLGKGFFMWNTKVENAWETNLNLLPEWLSIWVRVAGTDNCVVGPFGEWIDP